PQRILFRSIILQAICFGACRARSDAASKRKAGQHLMKRMDGAVTVFQIVAFLVLGAGILDTFAFAQAQETTPLPAGFSLPPREFAPMTRSERFANYLVGLADPRSIARAAASAGIQQASNTPKEWGRGADG